MSSRRNERLKECFLALVDLPEAERPGFLEKLREEDPELCEAVSAMLEVDRETAFLVQPPALPDEEPLPERIGKFRVVREIGAGGMGRVFEAEQERPHRRIALKILDAGYFSPSFARRFEFEGELLARLSHPGIAQVFETGTAEGPHGAQPYIAMELIDGLPLTRHARERGLDRRARVELLAAVADAVEHAHRRGVLHRDLKPANVLVDAEGRPRILDFGIGRVLDTESRRETVATQAGQVLGTLQYMSPEQARGDSHGIDTRADVYALGMMLHELLAGTLPYETSGKPLHAALAMIITSEPARLSVRDASLAGDLEIIVAKALEKEPEGRYGSAAALAEDLRRHLANEPILARPATRAYRLRRFARRHPGLVLGLTTTFVALVIGLAGTTWQALVARRNAREASASAETAQAILKHLLLDGIAALDPRELGAGVTAADVFARVEQHLEESPLERPSVEAAVRDALGTIWRALGDPARAEPLLRRALELARELHGSDDPRTLDTMEHLASCLQDRGRTEEALGLSEEVFTRRSSVLGAQHPATLVALNDLATALWSHGRTAEALGRMREAVRLREQTLGAAHEDTLSSKGNLAVFHDVQGEHREAERLHLEVLERRREKLAEDHPDVLRARSNLARSREVVGALEDPEGTWRELLADHVRAYGADHPLTALPMQSLAAALDSRGNAEEAGSLYRRSAAMLTRSFGEAHRDSIAATSDLVRFLDRHGKSTEALELVQRMVAVQRESLPPGHRSLVLALNTLGQSLRRAGRPEEARAAYEEGIASARATANTPSEALSQCLYNLGVLMRSELALPGDAVPLLGEALELDRRAYPEGHSVLAGDLFHLGSALVQSDRPAEAEAYLRQLLAKPYDLGPAHERTPTRRALLGTCLAALGRHEEAVDELEAAASQGEAVFGPEDERTRRILTELERVLELTQ